MSRTSPAPSTAPAARLAETSAAGALGMAFAVALPSLLAFNLSPSATLLNQLLAVAGWGWVLTALARQGPGVAGWQTGAWRAVQRPLAALGLLVVAVAASWAGSLPGSLAGCAVALLAAAAAVMLAAQAGPADAPAAQGAPAPWWPAVMAGLVLAGVLGALIGVVQVFFPAWADGQWIAKSGLAGRAVGNLRQPNHLSTQLVWGLIALVPLAQAWRQQQGGRAEAAAAGLGALMVLGVVLTASRTGVLGVLLLAAWGLLDKGLPRRLRVALLLAPVLYVLCWLAVSAWAHQAQQAFGGEARLAENDLSSSRVGIWLNTLALIQAQPWTGVGFGNFNLAWSLTPFPDRPVAFFDHSHNLPLQLAVELGLPLAAAVMGLLLAALWQGWRRSGRHQGLARTGARAAWVMVLLAGVHSLLEYPLWYAYFLLPTAWALGHSLQPAPTTLGDDAAPPPQAVAAGPVWPLRAAAALLLGGAVLATGDYLRVTAIYQPGPGAAPLDERIARGHDSLLYRHHADYAAATTGQPPELREAAFRSTTHALLDTRLMMAWADALAAQGETGKASYLAARLREFRNPATRAFFAACEDHGPQATAPAPYACQPAPAGLSWRDFAHGGR